MNYEEICSFETLYRAYLEARKCKRQKAGTAQYEANALVYTDRLSRLLLSGSYRPSKFEIFKVYEPKERTVQAPAFVDKVVQHAIVDNVLYEAICKSFIRDNYASQKGKGTHDGLMRLKSQMLTYYRRYNTVDGWVLKCDVRHFFASIDHGKLKEKLQGLFRRRGLDTRIYYLLCIYIDASEGLPLGYQTSQLLALLFLDEFDHEIKERRRLEFYGRYMDDFYIIGQDKAALKSLLSDVRKIMSGLGLSLNEKTGIFPLRNGIDFLGFHTYLTETGGVVQKLRRSSIDRIRGKVKYWKKEYQKGTITKEKIRECFLAWDAYAAHGDTYALRRKYADQVEQIIGQKIVIHRAIRSTIEARARRRAKQGRCIQRKKGCTAPALRSEPTPDDLPPWM
jgi:hypothetical protein